jgi:Holliday junction DNA helicase RuvB
LKKINISYEGLNDEDICYLKFLQKNERNVGLKSLSQYLDIPEETIINKIEPYLLKKNYIFKSSNGRIITADGTCYLKRYGLM